MQFGVFSVGDVTTDPSAGRTPTEAERIRAMVTIAVRAGQSHLQAQGARCGSSAPTSARAEMAAMMLSERRGRPSDPFLDLVPFDQLLDEGRSR